MDKELETQVIKLLADYSDQLRGDKCMPTNGLEMISKSGEVKNVIKAIKHQSK